MDLLLTNLELADVVAGSMRSGLEVLVNGNRIAKIGEGLDRRADTKVIDLGGRTLMPGLIDCHLHICPDLLSAYPAIFPSLLAARAKDILKGTLARGFTTARDAGGADVGYRMAIEEGLFEGPRLFVAGRMLSQTAGHADGRPISDPVPIDEMRQYLLAIHIVDGVDQVRRATRREIRTGVDQIKIMASGGVASPVDPLETVQFSKDELKAIVDETRRYGKYVMAHAYNPDSITHCLEAGVRTIEHGNFLTDDNAKQIVAADAYLVPTLVVYRRIVEHGAKLGVSALHQAKAKQVMDSGTRSLAIAAHHGVKMAFGTDLVKAPKHFQNDEFLIRAEVLDNVDIIRSATSIAAEVLQAEDRLGRIEEGYLADLIVVEGNPFEDISHLAHEGRDIVGVMKDGIFARDDRGLAA